MSINVMSKQKALVSGGASGLGLSVSRSVIENGGRVFILDINQDQGKQVAEELGEHSKFISADISNPVTIDACVSQANEFLGGINLLVNCAGVLGAGRLLSKKGPMTYEFFKRVIDVNLMGSFLLTRSVANTMKNQIPDNHGERGVVIFTSSIAAFEGQIGQVAYSASKAAIAGMTLPLARELSRFGIRVVSIAPGIFETPMLTTADQDIGEAILSNVPFPKRFGKAQEFANLVQHIWMNQMLNGTTIRLDAGMRLG